MKKTVSETLRAEKSAERTKKAAIHPIIRESPLLLIKAVIFCHRNGRKIPGHQQQLNDL